MIMNNPKKPRPPDMPESDTEILKPVER